MVNALNGDMQDMLRLHKCVHYCICVCVCKVVPQWESQSRLIISLRVNSVGVMLILSIVYLVGGLEHLLFVPYIGNFIIPTY